MHATPGVNMQPVRLTLRSSRLLRAATAHLRRSIGGATGSSAQQQRAVSVALYPGSKARVPPAAAQAPRIVLGIESSCDDTGVGIVTSDGRVLGEAIAGQVDIHAPWGGVVPMLAQEAHRAAIDRVVSEALQQAQLQPHQLDAVAVTVGPGLSLCLDVGVRKARALCRAAGLPLIPVHHMEAHALVARLAAGGLDASGAADGAQFPFLCLLVSGGHNLLVLVRGVGSYLQIGTTVDDAIGEAYDKVARMLGLELRPHGGAALEAFALRGDPQRFRFAIPMERKPNCDFSYAGLKTSVRLCIEKEIGADASTSGREQYKADIAASFQRVAVTHLVQRVKRGIAWARETEPALSRLVVAGGVASNKHVRSELAALAEASGLLLEFPQPRWCTDNGVMVAWAGQERLALGLVQPPPPPLEAGVEAATEWIEMRPRWPLTTNHHPRADTQQVRSMKVPKQGVASLTEVTQAELAALQAGGAAGGLPGTAAGAAAAAAGV